MALCDGCPPNVIVGLSPARENANNAYVLSDRPSWLNLGDKGDLKILMQGDPRMFNQYSVILVNPKKHPQVKQEPATRFIDYLTWHRIDGRWLITSKGFHLEAVGGQSHN